ncbi:hypothetical protein RLW55_05975 [Hyphomicrobium sp. B1]|uniref:hypothetical protein n=1 Tax=Hyphomicrobium sp. B1 TaxID=3075651 RepID=UPI003C2D3B7B
MVDELDLLEQRLLALGRKERRLEDNLREIPLLSRAAAVRGDFKRADELFLVLEEARKGLKLVQKDVTALEVRLYRLRKTFK